MRRFSLTQDEEDIIVIDPSLRAKAVEECSASLVDNVDFHEIDFWVQLWGLPFECISPEFGRAIGSRIGMVIDVSKGTDQGDRGQYIRVRIRIPLDRPLRRGGHVALGEGDKVWVDYKYERLLAFCHYCGMLDHDVRDCMVKSKDVVAGVTKENAYGAWLAASQGFQRGYKWKGAKGDFQGHRTGWDDSSRKQSLVFSGGGGSGGGRTKDDSGDK
ncbi:hypothetical protein RHGRI_007912 [Rhododendron griersonianum]|uniref:Zinc knuckle CX2CX4HX4C domain-containing protein n=1 Tax=Rhododendron griersonianum TaxID=479676 RepID=A0AAV6KYP9_9ERIC|nr:hypothetical protein RHGRI_007912 [Rhododendron griersonianum]